jgi:hypothetical protein
VYWLIVFSFPPWRIHHVFIYITRLISLYNSSNRLLSLYNSTSWLQRLYLTNFIYLNSSLTTWLGLLSWTLSWLNFFLNSVFKLNWILWSFSWLKLLDLNKLKFLIFILLGPDLNRALYLGILLGSDSFRSPPSTWTGHLYLTKIQLYLLVESFLYKLDVPVYKNVSYPKQISLLISHIFVLLDLLTRVFTRSDNSLPNFLPGRLPKILPEIVPNSLPESLPGVATRVVPEHVTQSFTRVLPGHVPDWVNPALPERLPDRVTSLTRGLPDRVTFYPIAYPALPDFLTRSSNFLLALPEALPMPTL